MFILPLMLRERKEGNVYIAFNVTGKEGRQEMFILPLMLRERRQEMFILPLMLRERKEGRKCLYCL